MARGDNYLCKGFVNTLGLGGVNLETDMRWGVISNPVGSIDFNANVDMSGLSLLLDGGTVGAATWRLVDGESKLLFDTIYLPAEAGNPTGCTAVVLYANGALAVAVDLTTDGATPISLRNGLEISANPLTGALNA